MSQLLPYIYGIHTATIVAMLYIIGNYYGHLYKVGEYTFSYTNM